MTGRTHTLEMKAFSARLGPGDRTAAQELWDVFAETKAILASVHATWALSLAGDRIDVRAEQAQARRRALVLAGRVAGIRLRDDVERRHFAAALRDFAQALGNDHQSAFFTRSALAYETGRRLAEGLWAFELAPEGAPLDERAALEFTA